VIAAGFPISDLLNNGLNVTTGNISALSGIQGDRRFVQITTPVQPGNSGGPLLDASGRVVGIVSRGLKNEVLGEGKTVQNINYAVAPYVVRAFLEEHRVPFTQARDSRETAESIAAKAQSHTVRLECYA
jgi:S1-C subfamily serine protease